MRVHVLGCRGSTPATGEAFIRYGGDTSSVAVASDDGAPTLVLDAGTGLSQLSDVLGGAPFRGAVVLGHLHWDHTHGLPFAGAVDHPDAEVDLLIPAQGDDAEAVLGLAMSPPHFPIRPSQLRGHWRFHLLDEGVHQIAGFEVTSREIPHTGGRTFGYRIAANGRSLAYLSDHAPGELGPGPDGLGARHPAARQLAESVDLLVHDAQYTVDEYPRWAPFGHSAIDYAIGLGDEAEAAMTVLFHHDPRRTDADLDRVAMSLDDRIVVAAAGAVFDL